MQRNESTQPTIQPMGEGYRLLPVPPTVQGDVSVPLRRTATTVGLMLFIFAGLFVLCLGDAVGGPALFVGLVLLGAGVLRGRGWDKWTTLLLVCGVSLLGAGALLIASAYLLGVVLVLAGAVGEWEWQHQLRELAPRGMGYEEQRTPVAQGQTVRVPEAHYVMYNKPIWTPTELAYLDLVKFVDLAREHGTAERKMVGLQLRPGVSITQGVWADYCKQLIRGNVVEKDRRGNLKFSVDDRDEILDALGIPAKYRG
jgi:hypothetical protein